MMGLWRNLTPAGGAYGLFAMVVLGWLAFAVALSGGPGILGLLIAGLFIWFILASFFSWLDRNGWLE